MESQLGELAAYVGGISAVMVNLFFSAAGFAYFVKSFAYALGPQEPRVAKTEPQRAPNSYLMLVWSTRSLSVSNTQ